MGPSCGGGFDFLERRAHALWAPIARCASTRLCIAELRKDPACVRTGSRRQLPRHRYQVAPARRSQTIEYLRAREQVTRVYREAWRRVWLDDDPQESVHALCYVVDRGHGQYAGRLSLTEQLHYARQGHGRSGACRDYVLATVKEMRRLGIRDTDLQTLAAQLKGSHGSTMPLNRSG